MLLQTIFYNPLKNHFPQLYFNDKMQLELDESKAGENLVWSAFLKYALTLATSKQEYSTFI